jgi:predicted metal-dependent hydrolase
MPSAQANALVRNSLVAETACHHNDKSVRAGMQTNETDRSNAAEDALQLEMPTRALTILEASEWLQVIAENEDVDPPRLTHKRLSRNLQGLAISADWCIAVRSKKPNQLLLLHEMAHLVCANKNHGTEFRTQVVRFVRRYVSVTHAARLHALYEEAGLSVDPFSSSM